MTLDPWAEITYVRALQLRWSKCNQNKPWAKVTNVPTFQIHWRKYQLNIRLAFFRGLTLAKNTINIKQIMIYACEAKAFQRSITAQNVDEACCTNRQKRESWHRKIGWLHKTRFHFLVWCSGGGEGGGVKPKMSYEVLCRKKYAYMRPEVNSNRFEISLWGKIPLRCELTL